MNLCQKESLWRHYHVQHQMSNKHMVSHCIRFPLWKGTPSTALYTALSINLHPTRHFSVISTFFESVPRDLTSEKETQRAEMQCSKRARAFERVSFKFLNRNIMWRGIQPWEMLRMMYD